MPGVQFARAALELAVGPEQLHVHGVFLRVVTRAVLTQDFLCQAGEVCYKAKRS
jgi:hypothetical protein